MFPNKEQWKSWSLPDKLTAIGTVTTIIGLLISIIFFFAPLNPAEPFQEEPTIFMETRQKKRVIEGEIFQVCNVSGLFFTASHEWYAILRRKNGVLVSPSGNILSGYTMSLYEKKELSANCFITIVSQYDVQGGHSGFEIMIKTIVEL